MPALYASPCVLVMKANSVNRKTKTSHKSTAFNRLYGFCKLCKLCQTESKHIYEIFQNPFSENGEPIFDVTVKITVLGFFYKNNPSMQ